MGRFGYIPLLCVAALLGCGSPPSADTRVESLTSAETVTESGVIKGYDSRTAMNLSGDLVPAEVQGYYFIEFVDGTADGEYVAELRELLLRTHADQDYLGIVAQDADRLRRIVRQSLEDMAADSLDQATVIIIARARDEAELRPLIEATGARLSFGVYLPLGAGLS